MSAIEEIKQEIINRHRVAAPEQNANEEPKPEMPVKGRKKMTKAEIEAYRQRMIEKEEAMYLGKKKGKRTKKPKAQDKDENPKDEPKEKKTRSKVKDSVPKMPNILPPLEPLYLLKIPGLPKGDLVAICIVHGA